MGDYIKEQKKCDAEGNFEYFAAGGDVPWIESGLEPLRFYCV